MKIISIPGASIIIIIIIIIRLMILLWVLILIIIIIIIISIIITWRGPRRPAQRARVRRRASP